jgi:hypothetical protein
MFRILGVVSALALAAAFSHPCAIAATRPAAEDRGGPGGQGVPRRQDSATTVDTGGQDDAATAPLAAKSATYVYPAIPQAKLKEHK